MLVRHPLLGHSHGQRLLVECLAALCGAAAAEGLEGRNVQRALHLHAHAKGSEQRLVNLAAVPARLNAPAITSN